MQALSEGSAGRAQVDAGRRLCVLIVDDDDADRLIVRRALRGTELPLVIQEAATAQDAMRRLAELPCDCLFVDAGLPGTALAELLDRAAAAAPPGVATVLLCDAGDESAAIAGPGRRAQSYLAKSELGSAAVRRALLTAVDSALVLRQLREQTDARSRLERELARYAGVMARDVEPSLGAVVGHLRQLERHLGDRLDGPARDCLERAIDCARRMQSAAAGIAELDRIGRDDADFARCDSGELLAAAVDAIEPELAAAGARVRWGSLPVIDCQRRRIVQLFTELVRHRLAQCGGHAPEISVAAQAVARGAVERAEQAGASRHETLWEFSIGCAQAATAAAGSSDGGAATADADGRLALCHRIVEKHRGLLRIEPDACGGRRVRFSLPGTGAGAPRPAAAG